MSDDQGTQGLDLEQMAEIRPGAWVGPDEQMVVNERLVEGLRFGHRPSEAELEGGWLAVVPDLAAIAGFGRQWTLAGGAEVTSTERQGAHPALILEGPSGWLEGRTLGDGDEDRQLLVSIEGTEMTLAWGDNAEDLDPDPAPVLAAYEGLGGGDVPLLDLVVHLLIEHRQVFETDIPIPLEDTLAVAGLVVAGTTVRRAGAPTGPVDPVGIPGLGTASALAAERLLGAVLAAERGDAIDLTVTACLADVDGVAAMAEQLVGGDLVAPEHLATAIDRLAEGAAREGHAGLSFLRSRLAEWQGDAAAQEAELQPALAAGFPSAQVDAASFAGDRGDAREALSLLRTARVPNDDPDLQLVSRYTAAGPHLVGRNDPCWCGSGRKHKQCCLRLNGHDLTDRTPWLHAKAISFLQRPPQRTVLLTVATASAGVESPEAAPDRVIAAACDATVAELCLFEGGLFERFVDQRGTLLPDDERELAASWTSSRHRLWEVSADGGVVRDRSTGDEREIDEHSATKVPAGGTILAVAQPGPMLLPGPVMPVTTTTLDELQSLLSDGKAESIAAFLGRELGWTAAPDLVSREADPAPETVVAP